MGFLIRSLLIWLLVLAVPAQGVAATTMAFCGAGAAHEHHDLPVQAEADHSASTLSGVATKASDASAHQCSACASCCSVGGILGSVLAVPAPVFAQTIFWLVVPRVDTFAAGGPDRPPRAVLA